MAWGFRLACLILIHLGFQQQTQAFNVLMTANDAIGRFVEITQKVDYVTEIVQNGGKSSLKELKTNVARVMNKMNAFDSNIIAFSEQLYKKIPDKIHTKLEVKLHELNKIIIRLNNKIESFEEIVNNILKYNINTVIQKMRSVVALGMSELPEVVKELHTSLHVPDIMGESILTILSEGIDHSYMCRKNQSPQQMINEIFKVVVYTDLKSVVIGRLAHDVIGIMTNDFYAFDRSREKTKFVTRVRRTYTKVVDAMKKASRDIWRCDPKTNATGRLVSTHQHDDTYSTLQEIFQSVLVFERDLEPSCYGQCSSYNFQNSVNSCDSFFCKSQRKSCRYKFVVTENTVHGAIRDCMDTSDQIDVCYAPSHSRRQYDWFKIDGKTYGRVQDSCGHKLKTLNWEWPSWDKTKGLVGAFSHCNYCLCTCEDLTLRRSRYFSLGSITSQVQLNKVITGVRFRKKDLVFYIEIQQGELGANGTIGSVERRFPYAVSTNKILQLNLENDKEDHPVYKVSWNRRTVYLDEFINETPSNKVLTGLRFRRVGQDIRLEAKFTEFDYATGKLGKSQWQFNSATRSERINVSKDNVDDPLRHINDDISSESGSYVQFRMTSMEKDMGQLTVPFIDLQPVAADPPLPITGISLFLKATQGSGGFLAFKLTHYDFSPYL